MSCGGKKKKSSSSSSLNKNNQKKKEQDIKISSHSVQYENVTVPISNIPIPPVGVDVLDRLAPPILFFPPNVSEEYLNRFCPAPFTNSPLSSATLLADEGFPDREIPVMRRLLAMMAGIMSKASASSARAYYSRVAGSEGRRNGYFQQNLNTSVFNLFSTLSASSNGDISNNNDDIGNNKDLHLTPASAFTAKDGESLRGYPQRLMKFWRQLSGEEQVRLVREEHASLTNSWIESRKNCWCLCSHCKHRRMTISDLTDCLYQTYCEELESFIKSNGNGSTLYSSNLNNSSDLSARNRRFLFKSLSVVGEQALLPRYNQFILRLETFSSMAFSQGTGLKSSKSDLKPTKPRLSNNLSESFEFDPKMFLKGLNLKAIDDDEDFEDFTGDNYLVDHDQNDDDDEDGHQGGIQSEDDDDLIDEETDLPIDESELMLPGGSSFPLLPVGEGPVQWSESSRIECGRTVFLMFASEMFQYRLSAAFLAHQTRQRQLELIAEVEAEEKLEKARRIKEEKERREKAEAEKKKKAAKKEKVAAKNNPKKPEQKNMISEKKSEKENVMIVVENDFEDFTEAPVQEDVTEVMVNEKVIEQVVEDIVVDHIAEDLIFDGSPVQIQTTEQSIFSSNPIFSACPASIPLEEDDFDPNELIEQLSKEMNRFEMQSVNNRCDSNHSSPGPPGFAPPPGFSAPEPKHLAPSPPLSHHQHHFSRPPFAQSESYEYNSGNSEMYPACNYQQNSQSYYPQTMSNYPIHSQNHNQFHDLLHNSQYYNSQRNSSHSHAPHFDPFQQESDNHNGNIAGGQSRFQSYFSKSIFGPSTFFSQ